MQCRRGHEVETGKLFCGTCGERLPTRETSAKELPFEVGDQRQHHQPSRRSDLKFVAAVIGVIVLLGAVALIAVLGSRSASSSSSDIATTTPVTTIDTTPLTPQQTCEEALPTLWNQEAGNGSTYVSAQTDVFNQYGYESAIFHAFQEITQKAIQKQYLVGQQAAANAALADVSTACSNALQQYSIDPSQETPTSY